MADIELVIKVDERDVDLVRKNYKPTGYSFIPLHIQNEFVSAILNGVPVPKGHGRLGDLDALEKEMINGIKAGNYEEDYKTFAHINNMNDCVECVMYAPTIIEADKTESEVEG